MPEVQYQTPYPNCPIPDSCGICRLLKAAKYELIEQSLGKTEGTVSVKKIRQKVNDQVVSTVPFTSQDKDFIRQYCVTAVLSSCAKDGEGGDEVVSVKDIDTATGKVYFTRENPRTHVGTIYLNFGVVTTDMVNDMLDTLCKLYQSVCGSFPPFATTVSAGIGKASAVNPANAGKPPTFVTTDDANWQLVLTALGKDFNTTNVGQFFAYLDANTSCASDSSTRKNIDILKDLVTNLCGRETCLVDVLDGLCGAIEVIKQDSQPVGIKFKGRYIEAEFGIKLLRLYSNKRVGAINTAQATSYLLPAESGTGTPLTESFTGKGGSVSYIGKQIYDVSNVVLPRRGRLRITGKVAYGWNQGLVQGKIILKQGATTLQELTTFITDDTGSTRGTAYAPYTSPVTDSSIFELSDIINAGTVNVSFEVNFVLPITKTTSESSAIYEFSHEIQFVPET